MNLTPTEQEHHDAIKQHTRLKEGFVGMRIIGQSEAAQACAKITEREKLLFAIERLNIILNKGWHMFPNRTIIPKWMREIESEIKQLQQQLNELGK